MTNQPQTSLSPQIASLIKQFEEASSRARLIMKDMSDEQLTTRPSADGWSIAECIVHLNLTSEQYLPLIDRAIEEAREKFGAPHPRKYHLDLVGWMLMRALEPPPMFRSKTQQLFEPLNVHPVEAILPKFLFLQKELQSRIHSADGLALARVKVASPFNARIRYNLYSAFEILAAHQRRHLYQAEAVRKTLT